MTLTDEVKDVGGFTFVETIIRVNDGKDFAETRGVAGIEKAGGMQLPQAFGSASSYSGKYALGNMFLLDDTKDADATNDHGKTQESKPQQAPKPTVAKSATVPKAERVIVAEGDENFLKIVKGVSTGKATLQQALDKFNISDAVETSLKEKIQSLAEIV